MSFLLVQNEEVERQGLKHIMLGRTVYAMEYRESMGGSLLLTWKMVYVYGILPAEAGKY